MLMATWIEYGVAFFLLIGSALHWSDQSACIAFRTLCVCMALLKPPRWVLAVC